MQSIAVDETGNRPGAIPIIDLAPWYSDDQGRIPQLAHDLTQALSSAGAVYLINHTPTSSSESQVDQDELIAEVAGFFERHSRSAKSLNQVKNNRVNIQRGYFGFDQGRDKYKEGFDMGPPDLQNSEQDQKRQLFDQRFDLEAPTPWPEGDIAGIRLKELMERHFHEMNELGRSVMGLIGLGIGLTTNSFATKFTRPLSTLRIMHYLPGSESADCSGSSDTVGVEAVACPPHTDHGALTFLIQDCSPCALEIFVPTVNKDKEGWVQVDPLKGALLCFPGDVIPLLLATTTPMRATRHQVRLRGGTNHRYSVPFFFEPNADAEVRPGETYEQYWVKKLRRRFRLSNTVTMS